MPTTIAYLRVSTDKQTLENQRSEITRFANMKNLTVDRWVEEVVSGKVKEALAARKESGITLGHKKGVCIFEISLSITGYRLGMERMLTFYFSRLQA